MTREEALRRDVRFLTEAETGVRFSWIGFRDVARDGSTKNFIYWTAGPDTIKSLEAICEKLWKDDEIEAKIGPAVDLSVSLQLQRVTTGTHNDQGKPVLGLYIEQRRRIGFSLRTS